MPDPVKKPPQSVVDEIKTKVLLRELWSKFGDEPSMGLRDLHERDTKMINHLVNELAYIKAFLKENNIEVK